MMKQDESSRGKIIAYQDPDHEGNSPKYHTGDVCVEIRCEEPSGTAWSPLWCFRHNVKRMDRISKAFEKNWQ